MYVHLLCEVVVVGMYVHLLWGGGRMYIHLFCEVVGGCTFISSVRWWGMYVHLCEVVGGCTFVFSMRWWGDVCSSPLWGGGGMYVHLLCEVVGGGCTFISSVRWWGMYVHFLCEVVGGCTFISFVHVFGGSWTLNCVFTVLWSNTLTWGHRGYGGPLPHCGRFLDNPDAWHHHLYCGHPHHTPRQLWPLWMRSRFRLVPIYQYSYLDGWHLIEDVLGIWMDDTSLKMH